MMKYKKYIIIFGVVLVTLIVFNYGYTFAKYASKAVWDYYLKSKGFYFSSDYLNSDGFNNVDNNWDGGRVNFNIRNSLSDTLITDYDIKYKVECTVKGEAALYAKCLLNGTELSEVEGILSSYQTCVNNNEDEVDVSNLNKMDCELGGYEWVSEKTSKELYFDIVSIDGGHEISNVSVSVKVSSISPYKKTLSGDFILYESISNEDMIGLDYKDYSNYGRLVVTNNYSTLRCVKIGWDESKLVIDGDINTFNSYQTNASGYIKEITLKVARNSNTDYIFYKRNLNEIYDIQGFTIIDSEDC